MKILLLIKLLQIPQILRDARILRIFEGPTETLNSFLGSRLVHQGEELARFLSEGLNAATISQRLQALAAQIYHQYSESKVDPITATRWAYLLIGELATKGILLAAAEWAYTRSESPHLHQTVTWAQLQFEQAIANTLCQFENNALFWQANNIVERVSSYVNNIGDLEQNLAGEYRELDNFLRKSINKNLDDDPIESKILVEFEQIKQENTVLDSAEITETQFSNNYQSIQDWIANWLAGKLKVTVEKININQSFSDYGLDSVTAIELLHDLNQWLASPLELETYLIWQFSTIAQLANYIAEQLEKKSSPTPNRVQVSLLSDEAIDLNCEAILESEITPISNQSSVISQSSTIFLTGATGFLGAFLLAELLHKTSAKIYCLVRAVDENKALIRIQNNLDYYSLWQPIFSKRIIPVLGDICRPQLGISNEYFAKLAAEIDLIYHNAAVVNWVFPYSSLKSSNVLGTQEVLRLATQSKIKPVHYISTTAVFESPSYAGKVVCEQDPLMFSEGIYLGYSQSKWVAEKLVASARDRGLPVSIYRPPLISGHSRTGEWNIDDFTCLMIRGCVQMKAMPKLDYLMDLAPVDFVSRSIVYLSQQPESLNQVFHLNNPYPLHWNKFIEWIREYGYLIDQIPYQDWLNRLKQESISTNNPLSPLLSFFLKQWSDTQLTIPQMYQQESKPRIDCQQTILALVNSGITCPQLDDQLLHTYFEYLLKKGELNPPG
ncbi:thioester reductase domain-containing protein [Planktothrix mougeotii LEGE 06226]|uniref:Thioester reductase domain-containing protein n=1 Tax=Planktothrix mougeotii LEGE 06226 TaxID=1828728 RepID=A0ABR9UC77_9CYAN|nr:thioester reductase domain-containing protein [Planktothrix mougeotii LEGE 06226]